MARPQFKATDEQRVFVKGLAAVGLKHEDIAKLVGLKSPITLRKHFRTELDRGQIEANAQVAQTLYKMARSGNNIAATIFWMKTRGGWREQDHLQAPLSAPPFLVRIQERQTPPQRKVVPIKEVQEFEIVPERAA